MQSEMRNYISRISHCDEVAHTAHFTSSVHHSPHVQVMPHFVYMLRCAGNRIYTGYAVDVEARFEQHKSGKGAKFTKSFPPECILQKFELQSYEEALRLEARIKKLSRPDKERLAAGDPELTAELLGGLGETLDQKKKRIRKEARAKKADKGSGPMEATASEKKSRPAGANGRKSAKSKGTKPSEE